MTYVGTDLIAWPHFTKPNMIMGNVRSLRNSEWNCVLWVPPPNFLEIACISFIGQSHVLIGMLFFLTALLRDDLHTIKLTRFKCTIQWVLVCLQSYTTITILYVYNISVPLKGISCPSTVTPHSHPQPWAAMNLLSVSLNLPFLGVLFLCRCLVIVCLGEFKPFGYPLGIWGSRHGFSSFGK